MTILLEPEILLAKVRSLGFHVARFCDELEIYAFEEAPEQQYWCEVINQHKARLFEILTDEGMLDENGQKLDIPALQALREQRWPKRQYGRRVVSETLDMFEDLDTPKPSKRRARAKGAAKR